MTEEKKKIKKKKPLWKRILMYSGIGFLVLLIALIIIPIIFKDKIKDLILEEVNTMLKSDVAIGDFDLTVFSSFPKIKITMDNVTVTGRDEFDGLKLLDLTSLEAKVDFWSVIKVDDIAIRSVKLIEPNVYVRILENGEANYDIVKSNEELAAEDVDTTATPFKLSLNYYEIVNGNIIYDDQDSISPMFAGLSNLNHYGKGDLTSDIIHFKTSTTIGELLYSMGDDLEVTSQDVKLDGIIDLTSDLTSFDATALLGEILVKLDGQSVAIKELDLKGKGGLTDKGITVETKTLMEELSYKMGGLSYLNKVKTDLDLDLVMDYLDDGYRFTLKENNLKLNALDLSFDGFYEMLENESNMDLKLKTETIRFKDLLSLVPAFYHTGYESMVADGSLGLSGFLKGKLSDNSYPAWNFDAKVKNASIKYPDVAENIKNINIDINTKFPGGGNLDNMTIDVNDLTANFAGNTIDGNFFLKTPMSDPFLKSQLNMNVDLATLDKVYPMEEKYTGKLVSDVELEGNLSSIEQEKYQDFKASGNLNLQGFKYESEDLPDPVVINNLLFQFSPEKLKVAELDAKMGESNFDVTGELRNYMNYLFQENEELIGVLTLKTNKLDLDKFMAGESSEESTETATSEGSSEPILIPKNIDFTLNTTADEVVYDGIHAKNIKGKVRLKDEEAIMDNLTMNVFGGTVGLTGKYSSQNPKEPKVDFSWDIKTIDIKELAGKFVTIDKLAPIIGFVDGKISSKFAMNTSLKPDFEPIFSTLTGNGNFISTSLDIKGFEPLTQLAEKLQITRLSNQTIQNINASFAFENGAVTIKPFTIKMGGINTEIKGLTTFDQEIDFTIQMNIPKADIPQKIVQLAEEGIAKVNQVPFFNINLKELPEIIPVTAFLTNTITKPKVETNLKEKLMEFGGNVKEQIISEITDKVEEIKDSITTVVQDKVEEVKEQINEEIEKQKQQILNEAQKQADNVKAEAKKLANKTREEAEKNAQKLIDEAGINPLKRAGAEIAADQVRSQGEKAAKKIEDEAEKQADDIMKKARERADKLK